jgi:hypothetical protein
LRYSAFGGHLRGLIPHFLALGRAFHRVAIFDFIIPANQRLGWGTLLDCHLISHWFFRCKCTALFSSDSLHGLVFNMIVLSDGV